MAKTPLATKLLAEARYFDGKASHAEADAAKARIELSELKALVSEARSANSRNRVLDFGTAVTKESIGEARDQVSKWVRQEPKKLVTVVFNSPGGEVINGLALFDTLRGYDKRGTPIRTVCMGTAASMAGVLLQAGRVRVVTPNSYFLIHEIQSGGRGSLEEMKNNVAFLDKLNARTSEILAERSSLSAKSIAAKIKTGDWWLDSDECIKYGFADEKGYE